MSLDFLQLFHARHILQQFRNSFRQIAVWDDAHKVGRRFAQDENACAQNQQSDQGACQRIHPG